MVGRGSKLDGLRRQPTTEAAATALSFTIGDRLSFRLMGQRAGSVGTRLGREYLSVLTGSVRTHRIGHSLGLPTVCQAAFWPHRSGAYSVRLVEHGHEDGGGPIGHSAQRPGMFMPTVTEAIIVRTTAEVDADADSRPVIDGVARCTLGAR